MACELLKMATDDNVADSIKLAAIRDALDRAGLAAKNAVEVEVGYPNPMSRSSTDWWLLAVAPAPSTAEASVGQTIPMPTTPDQRRIACASCPLQMPSHSTPGLSVTKHTEEFSGVPPVRTDKGTDSNIDSSNQASPAQNIAALKRAAPTESRNMIDRIGEGLIKRPDCGAMVPSFASLIDQPAAPEHMTLCFRPVHDATMHNPGCTYCHDPETVGYLRPALSSGLTGMSRSATSSLSASCSIASVRS